MTGCPNCGHAQDPQTMVAKTTCPNCKSPLRACVQSCPYPVSEHHDPHCSARGYSCTSDKRTVFMSPNGLLHHHEEKRGKE